MMNAVETFGRLTAHGPNMIGGRGGKDRITAQDIAAAAALSEMQEGAFLLALAKGTEEPGAIRAWHSHWLAYVRAERPQWPQEMQTRMALLTSVDARERALCAHCGGAGRHRNQRDCAKCEGTGARTYTDADMAVRIGIRPASWADPWRGRYRELMAVLDEWASDADWAMRRAMG